MYQTLEQFCPSLYNLMSSIQIKGNKMKIYMAKIPCASLTGWTLLTLNEPVSLAGVVSYPANL